MNLDELVEFANTITEKVFSLSGAASSMYFMIDEDGKQFMMLAPFAENKDISAVAVRTHMETHRVIRYVHTNEAWTVHLDGTEAETAKAVENINNMGGVRNHPNRVEVLMLVAEDCREGYRSYHRDIIRDPGKRARLGPLVRDGYTQSVGRFVGMLPRPRGARVQ